MVQLVLTDNDKKAIVNYTNSAQFNLNSSLTVNGKVVNVVKNDNGDITVNGALGLSGQTPAIIIFKSEVEKIEKKLEDDNTKQKSNMFTRSGGRRRRARKTQRRKSTKRRHTRRYRRK